MSLTNPGRALGRSSLLLISRKLLTLSGIPLFSTNLFRVVSLLVLLVGLNLSFLIGTLAWFIKITKVVPFEFVKVKAKQGILIRLERWSEYWCLPLNLCKCEASFSVDPTNLTCSPTSSYSTLASISILLQLFLGSFLTTLFPFQRMHPRGRPSSSLVSRSYAVSLLPHMTPLRSLSFFCKKLFVSPFSLMLHPDGLLFLSVCNITKLERLYRASSRAITDCLSASPIPLLLSEASLSPL